MKDAVDAIANLQPRGLRLDVDIAGPLLDGVEDQVVDQADDGRSAGDFLRAERLNKAAEMLRLGEDNVTGIAYSVGYRSLSQFAKAFREQFGMAPSDFEA